MHTRTFTLLAGLALLVGCAGGGTTDPDGFDRESGDLSSGDETLTSGEYADQYTFRATPGEWIEVSMTSAAVDPYIILQPPGCASSGLQTVCGDRQVENDDFHTDGRSFIWHQADEDGTWRILATSSQPGETGAYELAYRVVPEGTRPATPGVMMTARNEQGQLVQGDQTLNSGEFVDYYGFVGQQGEPFVADLRSTNFDPYLILFMPNGEQLDNDDYEGDQTRSVIETTLPESGVYRLAVTSYRPGESGAYSLSLGGQTGAPAAGASDAPAGSGDPFVKQ